VVLHPPRVLWLLPGFVRGTHFDEIFKAARQFFPFLRSSYTGLHHADERSPGDDTLLEDEGEEIVGDKVKGVTVALAQGRSSS